MKTPAQKAVELENALVSFMRSFECVFDQDWGCSQGNMTCPHMINPKGTFLNPMVEDEENNWANRAGLLDDYRRLSALMLEYGVDPHDPRSLNLEDRVAALEAKVKP